MCTNLIVISTIIMAIRGVDFSVKKTDFQPKTNFISRVGRPTYIPTYQINIKYFKKKMYYLRVLFLNVMLFFVKKRAKKKTKKLSQKHSNYLFRAAALDPQ